MKNHGICLIMIIQLCISCNNFRPEVLSDSIIIREYQPFSEGTKALVLTETSTLRFENDLPKIDGATALDLFENPKYGRIKEWDGEKRIIKIQSGLSNGFTG